MTHERSLPANFIELLNTEALKLGFDAMGISKASQLKNDAKFMEDWLQPRTY